jgi:hypothetical protein
MVIADTLIHCKNRYLMCHVADYLVNQGPKGVSYRDVFERLVLWYIFAIWIILFCLG